MVKNVRTTFFTVAVGAKPEIDPTSWNTTSNRIDAIHTTVQTQSAPPLATHVDRRHNDYRFLPPSAGLLEST